VPVDPEKLAFLDGRLAPVFGDPAGWRRVRAAVTEVAEENSPEILALSKTAEAQRVQVARARRAYYLPTFSAGATYSDEIIEGDSSLPLFGDDFYTLSIDLSYPIFQGGLKASESAKAKVDLEAAERRLELARELVERRTRTSLRRVENSFPRIQLSRESARAAGENLVIVQDKYAEGIVNVTDLLSAQTEKFNSDRLAVASVHEFLFDLNDLQRAMSWFEHDRSPEEAAALVARLLEAAEAK
jgi:outer membrane protein TolC